MKKLKDKYPGEAPTLVIFDINHSTKKANFDGILDRIAKELAKTVTDKNVFTLYTYGLDSERSYIHVIFVS